MSSSRFFTNRQPDINALTKAHDIRSLIALLDHGNFDIQWHAADALGAMGAETTPSLINALNHPSINTRLGAIEALSAIRDTRAIEPLASLLASGETSELRWAAALALGEIGDAKSVPHLIKSLRDDERYVRYGAAKALEQLGWQPENDGEKTYYLCAIQEWEGIKKIGIGANKPLIDLLKEKNPAIRGKIVDLLGDISRVRARNVCERVLRDTDEGVRWRAILVSRKCGIPITHLPWHLSKRPKTGPSPIAAAVLNFFFLGQGYNYMGLWWGLLVFSTYMTLIVFTQLELGPLMPFLIAYPITALFATQTYMMAKKMRDM